MNHLTHLSKAFLEIAACGLLLALTVLPANAQTCTSQPPGMVAWWQLEETTGTVVSDVLGHHPGTASGPIGPSSNPTSMTGFVGGGLNFHFQSRVDVGDIGNDLDFGTNTSFTIDAWIKGHSSPIVGNISSQLGYYLYYASANSGSLGFEMGNNTSAHLTWSGPSIPAGVWTFVAAVVDRTNQTVTLYTATPSISSTLNTSGPFPIPNPNSVNASSGLPLRIGGCPGNPNGCDTVIDEVEIFNRPLMQTELQNIVNAGTAGKCKPKGMTWRAEAVNFTNGTITVGCANSTANPCNPYLGDRLCTDSLPLLCFKPFSPILPVPMSVIDTDFYNRWSGGIVGTTAPVQASSFNGSLALANARCVQEFGSTDWRVAEFHDGANGTGGWNFQAYGNVGLPASRFWVHIKDQPKGTCFPNP